MGMMRGKTQNFEDQLKGCKSLSDIRALADKFLSLKEEVLLNRPRYCLTNRLKLKDQPFTTFSPSSQNAMDELWTNLHVIDSSLLTIDTIQKSIASIVGILDFMNSHCKAMLSVKKCGLQSCQCCKQPRLPTEVFTTLHHLPPQPQGEKYPFMVLTRPRSTDHHLLNVSRKVMECPFHRRHRKRRHLPC